MRGALTCLPFRFRQPMFYPEADISIQVQTPEPPQEEPPAAQETTLVSLAQQVGQLQAIVSQLSEQHQAIAPRLEMLETEERWTNERISSIAQEVYSSLIRVEEQIETLQQEEQPEEETEEISEIPALPPADLQPEQQPPPEPETKKRPWFL